MACRGRWLGEGETLLRLQSSKDEDWAYSKHLPTHPSVHLIDIYYLSQLCWAVTIAPDGHEEALTGSWQRLDESPGAMSFISAEQDEKEDIKTHTDTRKLRSQKHVSGSEGTEPVSMIINIISLKKYVWRK